MTEPYRILVTGSRAWDDWRTITGALIQARRDGNPDQGPTIVVHGCALGADYLAAQAARKLGWEVEAHPAEWGAPCRPECVLGHRRPGRDGFSYCPAAGNYRNAEMVALGADACLAFIKDGSAGATHCAGLAEKAGIPVRRFTVTSERTERRQFRASLRGSSDTGP
jgi:hypothetical protein